MKFYYQVYDDLKKEKPTRSVICVFSPDEPSLRDVHLSMDQLMHHYHCLVTDNVFGEPVIEVCPLVYLIVWCSQITEEQAREIDPVLVNLVKITNA